MRVDICKHLAMPSFKCSATCFLLLYCWLDDCVMYALSNLSCRLLAGVTVFYAYVDMSRGQMVPGDVDHFLCFVEARVCFMKVCKHALSCLKVVTIALAFAKALCLGNCRSMSHVTEAPASDSSMRYHLVHGYSYRAYMFAV